MLQQKTRRGIGWAAGGVAGLLTLFCVVGTVIARREPILRRRVIETLSARFNSKVELDTLHVSLLRGLEVSGAGLRIFAESDPNNHEPGVQPIISVPEFHFRTSVAQLLRSQMHVDTVYLNGLALNLPPRQQRSQMKMSPGDGKIGMKK